MEIESGRGGECRNRKRVDYGDLLLCAVSPIPLAPLIQAARGTPSLLSSLVLHLRSCNISCLCMLWVIPKRSTILSKSEEIHAHIHRKFNQGKVQQPQEPFPRLSATVNSCQDGKASGDQATQDHCSQKGFRIKKGQCLRFQSIEFTPWHAMTSSIPLRHSLSLHNPTISGSFVLSGMDTDGASLFDEARQRLNKPEHY